MTGKESRWEGQSLEALRRRWDRANVHLYSRVDSTNARGIELAEEGAPAGTLVLADEQTAGRGAAGHGWYSPKGAGLYLSIVLRPAELPSPQLLPLLAGLSAARAAESVIGGGSVAVKWPNDLIVRDRKAGGVLSEAAWSGERPRYVVLGVGVNVHQKAGDFPPSLRGVAISLDLAAGRRVSRLELADLTIRELEARCVHAPQSLDREQLRMFDEYDWLRDRCCAVIEAGTDPVEGKAIGIAPDGMLVFRPEGGALRSIASAHVIVDELSTPDF